MVSPFAQLTDDLFSHHTSTVMTSFISDRPVMEDRLYSVLSKIQPRKIYTN